jgi:hypothetical protein
MTTLTLPLPKEELPEKLRRFGDPAAPAAAKAMAAKGLVPVKGEELVTLLIQLSADPTVGREAAATIAKLPDSVLASACTAALHPAILDRLVDHVIAKRDLLEEIASNRASADATIARIARSCDERMCERIAEDQQRLLAAPAIIESLYKNRNTRMSTVDRLVELAARNGVVLEGIATFAAHVEAIQGQLIPEPTDEPLPEDILFRATLEADSDDDPLERDLVDGTETVKETHKSLQQLLEDATVTEKLRLTITGGAAARTILIRDANKSVAIAAISSPATTESEAARHAASRNVGDDILRYIGTKNDWLSNYDVKKNLVFNPKTPIGISMKFIGHLRQNDLRALARSKNVPANVRTTAQQRLAQKEKR